MAKQIGRLHSFWLWIEVTAGTETTADAYIPLASGKLIPQVTKVTQEEGVGVIDQVSESYVTQKMSEFTGEGSVKSQSIGYLLLMALGTTAAPALAETGVHLHTFTRKNDNNHPSATIFHIDGTQQEKSVYHMLQNIDFSFEIGEKAMFTLATTGRKLQNTTGLTATFPGTDEDFLVNCMSIKVADTVWGLAGATPISAQSATFSIQKNLTQLFGTRTTASCEYEFDSQHNQAFATSGDFAITMDSKAYQEAFEDGDYKAMEMKLTGRSLIGATKYNEMTITIPKVSFESFDITDSLDEIVSQTVGFIGMYDKVAGTTATITLQNKKATKY